METKLAVLVLQMSMALFESRIVGTISRIVHIFRPSVPDAEYHANPTQVPVGRLSTIASQKSTATHVSNGQINPEMSPLPVVFIHKSNSDYLKYSLAQAKQSNPSSAVILIGDTSNDKYDFTEHYYIADYFHDAAQFGKIYQHFSSNPFEAELIWLQRWFILREFLESTNRRRCLYLDSDVMLYANVTDDCRKFHLFDFTLCWNTVGCVFFLNKLDGLERFCKFLMDIYSKKDRYHYDKMLTHYAVRRKNRLAGGAGDMTAFQLYSELNFGLVGEASHIIDGSVYDPNINMPHPGFEMENGIKRVIWNDGQPYGKFLRTGEEIRFNSLHFNGRAKSLMSQYCTADDSVPIDHH
jgi:hypothetical protein